MDEEKLALSFFITQSYVRLSGELKSLGVGNPARRWYMVQAVAIAHLDFIQVIK